MPIRARRLILALGRLQYMSGIRGNRTIRDAFIDSVALFAEGKSGWAGDMAIVLGRLPTPVLVTPADFLCPDSILAIQKRVVEVVDGHLQMQTDVSYRSILLHHRLELMNDALTTVTRRRRHYLTLVHHRALTLPRANKRYRLSIPREERLCRFCQLEVEDEVHALLECEGHAALVEMRDVFLDDLLSVDPVLGSQKVVLDPLAFLRRCVASRKGIPVVAKYVYEVLREFDCYMRYIPPGYGR
ncbi:reverse transcriptase domain-containing protein [Favolaschia claudopus]|uniref:Reverse transcriptase domain-containing protein n=1 Tax=Favolaschia claudopus TaxID=2862362 RepID=A0AAW0BAS2_9AGAR